MLLRVPAQCQPQWRFHLAFEDATGARDTIWHVWDASATIGSDFDPQVDYELGEGAVELSLDEFNVWVYNWDGDSTKTKAIPYENWFPMFPGPEICGFNYQYPITIRWDRSLFHADYLPVPDTINTAWFSGQYFYWYGNTPFPGVHSLLEEDSVVVLDLGEPLFPTALLLNHQVSTLDIPERESVTIKLSQMDGWLWVSGESALIQELLVSDLSGRTMHRSAPAAPTWRVDLHSWPTGLFIMRARTNDNTWHHAKFTKAAP